MTKIDRNRCTNCGDALTWAEPITDDTQSRSLTQGTCKRCGFSIGRMAPDPTVTIVPVSNSADLTQLLKKRIREYGADWVVLGLPDIGGLDVIPVPFSQETSAGDLLLGVFVPTQITQQGWRAAAFCILANVDPIGAAVLVAGVDAGRVAQWWVAPTDGVSMPAELTGDWQDCNAPPNMDLTKIEAALMKVADKADG